MIKSERKYLEKIINTAGRAINQYCMIEEGDRITVAMSGGKDSYLMLEALAKRKRFIPIDYGLHAVHVNIENIPYEIDREYMTRFCDKLGVPFHLRSITIDFNEGDDISPCFVCSWNRRKELFTFCSENNCNKLALGHHRDDLIETFIMNMIFQGSICSMPPKLSMFKGEIDIIRPLSLLSEKEILKYAELRNFQMQKKECPHGDDTNRENIKKIISDMEKLNKYARSSIFKAMRNVQDEYLP